MKITKGLIFMVFFITILAKDIDKCNSTHLDLFTTYSLGQQNQLNKTFTLIQQKITTLDSNVTYKANDTATYVVGNVKPSFLYFGARQKAQVVSNDTIIISGGRLDVRMPFSWTKIGLITNISGTGEAFTISDQIVFAKNISVEEGYIVYEVSDYNNITFDEFSVNITRIDPPNTTQEDIDNLGKMFSHLVNVTTVKHILEDEIEKKFFYYLNQSLYEQKRHITDHFEYEWVDPVSHKGKLTIAYGVEDFHVDVEPDGMRVNYTAQIKDFPAQTCDYWGPRLPLNPMIYGSQEFLSFDIYKNTIRYAIDQKFLDTSLEKRFWESRMFQFYAGDLYEVIPAVAQNFIATEEVTGTCKAEEKDLTITKKNHTVLNVNLNYDCELFISRSQVQSFKVKNMTFEVEGRAHSDHLKFHVVGFSKHVQFYKYDIYEVKNIELAELMVTHSLNRLVEEKVFGSGWPLFPKDYPHFIVEENMTIVYDSTHVDPNEQNKVKLE